MDLLKFGIDRSINIHKETKKRKTLPTTTRHREKNSKEDGGDNDMHTRGGRQVEWQLVFALKEGETERER